MKKTLRFLGLAFVIIAMVLTLSLTVFADDSAEPAVEVNGVQYATLEEALNAAKAGDVVEIKTAYVAEINGVKYATLQAALEAAKDGDTIVLLENITEDVVVSQSVDRVARSIVIDGNDKTLTGKIQISGGVSYDAENPATNTLLIKNLTIQAVVGNDACIYTADKSENNAYAYSHNVTIDGCTFLGVAGSTTRSSTAAIRHKDGGDWNWTVKNCTATDNNLHSFLQINNVGGDKGFVVDNCNIVSKNGLNINYTHNITVMNSNISVDGYVLRAGVNGNSEDPETFILTNNKLNSNEEEIIVLRGGAVASDIVMTENVATAPTHFKGNTAATVISADANYWGEGLTAPIVATDSLAVEVESYYSDSELTNLVKLNCAAEVNGVKYATLEAAINAIKTMTGDVTVEIYDKVTLNYGFGGSFTSIKFVGKTANAEIYLEPVGGYAEFAGKNIAFEDLTLSKASGGYVANAGFMNLAFGIFNANNVTYTNCIFANGAYASGNVTFTGCTFYRSHDRYGLWAYNKANITIDGCTFADFRGIKMYSEGKFNETAITVKNTNFSAVNNKPAIVLTHGLSVVLENNTYSKTGVFELDLDGKPNGVSVTSDVAPTCKNDNGACGVLVDGKIYTTVAQAAEVATEGSKVTLLHDSNETVEFEAGVELDKNGFEANGVTVAKKGLAGTGTEADPYLITSLEELFWFRDHVNSCAQDGSSQYTGKFIKLKTDIDLAGYNWIPIGSVTKDHGSFYGTFDGDGHTISNLYVNMTGNGAGFFAKTSGGGDGPRAVIKNLKFKNVNVKSTGSYVGGVIANAGGNTEVSNITVTGNIYVEGNGGYVGGIVGHGYPDMYECSVIGNDGSYVKSHYWCAGGIIGYAGEGGTILEDCYVENIDVYGAYGGAAAVAGLLQDGNKVDNVSAKNVTITSDSDYCMGYIAGNGVASTLTNISVENVTATAKGSAITATDAVATVNGVPYFDIQAAINAIKTMTGDVTVEIYDKVTLNYGFGGSFTSIKFVGKTANAEIYLEPVGGYAEFAGKNIAFEDLTLSKASGGYVANAGFMNLAFGIFNANNVTYTNCIFANGAYASGNVTFTGCTFYRSHDRYGLWAYNKANITIDGCTFADFRGIKMYSEGKFNETAITVKNTNFSAVNNKPAIVLTHGLSVVLENNTYSKTGVFELDLDGKPNGVSVTSDVAPTCKNDNGACGVLVDGKIYTTVAQAAEVATEGSKVTLLHDSNETVEFEAGVELDKNGFEANGVTVAKKGLAGTGTEADPYLITSLEELFWFRDHVNSCAQDGSSQYTGKFIKLKTDIDLAGYNWIPIGSVTKDHGSFYGTFDGDGHTISNLYVNMTGNGAGFFAKTSGGGDGPRAVIKNLKFKNVNVKSTGSYVGGVIANAGGNTEVSNITVTGNIYVEGNGGYVGGIVGHGYPDMYECSVIGNDGSYVKSHYWCAGGIIGYAGEGGTILEDCYVENIDVYGAYGGAAAVAGLLQDGNKVDNVSAKNVTITSDSDYCMGYIAGNGVASTLTNISVENVTATAKGSAITATDAVATVNGVPYFDIQAAINAAKNGETVKVLCDIELDGKILVAQGTNAVLDLNGFTVSYETSVANDALMQNCGTLKIVNGTITFKYVGTPDTTYSKGNYTISNQGKLTVGNGATILNTTAKMSHACYTIDNNTCASSQGATLIVNEGATIINENNYAVRQFAGGTAANKITVNGGIIKGTRAVWMQAAGSDTTKAPIIELTVNGGTLEATGESADYKLAVYSYSYGNSLANTKIAVSGGTIKGDIALTGGKNKTTAETVVISGGIFEGKDGDVYSYAADETAKKTITVTGGTFTSNYPEMFAVGYKFVVNANGTYSPKAQLPTADVNNLGQVVISDYLIYDLVGNHKLTEGTKPIAIPVTMQFVAKDTAETAAKHPYANYTTDYYITIAGPEGESFVGNGCYLAGYYEDFDEWVIIPLDGFTVEYNKPYSVITSVGFNFTYKDICTTVRNFKCGMALSENVVDYLASKGYNSPVSLDLGLAETMEKAQNAEYETVSETTYTTDEVTVKVAKIGDTYYTSYADAFNAAVAGNTVEILVDGDFEPTVANGLVALKNFAGNYVVGVKPTATVNNLGSMSIPAGGYGVWDGKNYTSKGDTELPLSFVMQFIANETAQAGKNSAYADWYADFVITFDGIEDGSFIADGCYLAGYYGNFGWVKIPVDGMKIEDGVRYPVMLGVGLGQKYDYICSGVETFQCALYIPDSILEANPNLKVNLELSVIDNMAGENAAAEELTKTNSDLIYKVESEDYENAEFIAPTFVAEVDGIKYGSFQTALANANGKTIKLLTDVTITSPIVINKGETVVIDLAGCMLDYNSTTMGEAMITNRGTLTINDTVGNGEIYYNYTGANDPSYGKGNYTISNGGTLTVNGGKIHIAKLSAHAKYPIDNNSTTGDAILVINGGHLYNYNTSAIRQFCNSTTYANSVTINGGKIEGYSAIWVQNPGKNTVNGNLTINGGEIKSTAKAYVEGSAALNEVGSNIYFTIAGEGGAWSESSFVALNGGTFNENVYLAENAPANYTIGNATFNGRLELPAIYVAEVDGIKYTSLADAIANANGKTVVILENINLASDRLTIKAGNTVTIDLNGFIVSGTCDEGQDHMIMVENTAKLVICDSSDAQTGKITYAQGASDVGWAIDLEGELVLESGTIELTGDSWSIGYAVDVRPNAWATAYTEGTVFTMNGGKVVSSDAAIRVASSSSDTYTGVSASFVMNGGEIESGWDGIFIQQSNTIYDNLNVEINDGKITSALAPIRFYGPAMTSSVGGSETSAMSLEINGGEFVCEGDASKTWIIPNVIMLGGGATVDEILAETTITKVPTANLTAPEGYEWSTANGVDTLVEKPEIPQLTWHEVTLTLGTDLRMNFYIYKDGLVDGVHYYAKVVKIHGDGCADGVETYYIPMEKWEETPTRMRIIIDEIAAKEMNCTFAVSIYAGEVPAEGEEEGTQVAREVQRSIVQYALWMIRNNKNATAIEKTLMVDMLNYGAAAQEFFHHYDDKHLANADLTEAEKALATTEINSTPVLSVEGSYAKEVRLELKETTYLNIYFKNIKNIEGFDINKLSVNVRFAHHAGTEHNVTVTGDALEWKGDFLMVSIRDLTAADANIAVTCEVSYNGEAITTVTTNIAKFCDWAITSGQPEADICKAIMKYATSAYKYFHE